MKAEFDRYFGILTSAKDWQTFAVAGGICLAAVMFNQLLFVLALIFFVRSIWLAWPILMKKYNEKV